MTADPLPYLESDIRQDLASLRISASRFFIPLIWLHVPVVGVIAWSNHVPAAVPTFIMVCAASAATLAVWRSPSAVVTRSMVAAVLTLAAMLMVYGGEGQWQIDWHMYFFVVFGMLVAYVDWLPIVIAAVLTAAHHTILSVIFPAGVFPQSDPPRVLLHAAIVGVDVIVLLWAVRQMHLLFSRIGQANGMLEARVAERTAEVNTLNAALGKKLRELEVTFTDLEAESTQRKEIALRLDHLAHHDLVTGLPNRVLLMDRLRLAMANAERIGTDVVVISLDLDNFKTVNDTIGHAAGDDALALIATRLRRCMRTTDTASRVGGDEFVIVYSAIDAIAETAHIANRLIATVSEPIEIGASAVVLGASIGISLFPGDGGDAEELVQKADAAMYRAKQSGRNTFHLYSPAIQAAMLQKATLRRDLEDALARDEFVLHYQPIVSLTSGLVIGAEALVRWQHPTRGLLPPSEFVGFAEEHGLISEIGATVMHKACAQINRFALGANDEFTMAVNVSALQFRQAGFVDFVSAVLAEHRVASARLEIEITESVIVDDATAVTRILRQLEALGLKLSIDDFGTGYSSLAYIKTFPVHTLKIDRSFVNDVADNPTDQAIAATIITLAHNLGMRVIAEGIETEEQLEQLRLLGADDMQGFLISRPMAAADFERFVCSYGSLKLAA